MDSSRHPPRVASWLLVRFRWQGDSDILLGDLEEEFQYLSDQHGDAYARRWYWTQVLVSIPGFFSQTVRWSIGMFHNYLKVALRTFRKQRVYTAINVTGLAIGISCCMLLFLFVRDELSFDRFHQRADRIYRLERIQRVNHARSSFTDGATGPALVEQFPEIEAATRTFRVESLISVQDKRFFGEQVAFVDSSFMSMFSFRMIGGEPESALVSPNTVVLTEDLAKKYFGSSDPIGHVVRIDNDADYTVTGVVENTPSNSHYRFDALASFPSLYPKMPWLKNFGSIAVRTYVLLAPDVTKLRAESLFPSFLKRYDTFSESFYLRPLKRIHLYSHVYEIDPQGDISSVYLFAGIAFIILLLACINYVNLTTARAASRMREVGMRKILGADRVHLFFQFLGESVLLVAGAIILAIVAASLALPTLNAFLDRSFNLIPLLNGEGFWILFGFAVAVSLMAGAYPAVYLARFKPARVLKSGRFTSFGGSLLRQFLVVSQFAVSIVLLCATLVIMLQLRFMRSEDLGFDQEHVVNIYLHDGRQFDAVSLLKNRLLADPQVINVTVSSTAVDEFNQSGPVVRSDDVDFADETLAGLIHADEDYVDTFGMQLAAGDSFTPGSSEDDLIINETLAREIGWGSAETAVGKQIQSRGWGLEGTVIGVVKDFKIRSLHSGVTAVILINQPRNDDAIVSVRLRPGDSMDALARFSASWSDVYPDWPFEPVFLDDVIQQRYNRDQREGQLFSVFAGLALLIACLGLFGLASFMGQQRSKEVGIRKALGAGTSTILFMLSREFTLLVGIAFVIAVPIAYSFMSNWLDEFAFHIGLEWYVFGLAGLIALLIAWLTISYQSIRSARISPVEILRTD